MSLRKNAEEQNFDSRRAEGKRSSGVLFSLTSIFFVFGILLAFGVRSIESVRQNERDQKENLAGQQQQLTEMQRRLAKEKKDSARLQASLSASSELAAQGASISKIQLTRLNTETKKLQMLLGLTPVKGEGIVIRLADNPQASANAGPDAGSFLPGIVHDFDLLQVVNELRSAKAEAIAINGVRITGYTPIRCVGPVIYINYEPKPAPFVVQAIGDADGLESAVSMPGGIIENLKNQTLGIKISQDELTLPAAEGLPPMKVAQAG